MIPEFNQHTDCYTRGDRTLDYCYYPFKDGYKAKPLPPIGLSDHSAIILMPKYKQWLKHQSTIVLEVIRLIDKPIEIILREHFYLADWDIFQPSSGRGINELTEAVVGLIGKIMDYTTPKATISINQKP